MRGVRRERERAEVDRERENGGRQRERERKRERVRDIEKAGKQRNENNEGKIYVANLSLFILSIHFELSCSHYSSS